MNQLVTALGSFSTDTVSTFLIWTVVGVMLLATLALGAGAALGKHAALRHTVLFCGLISCLLVPIAVVSSRFTGPVVAIPLVTRSSSAPETATVPSILALQERVDGLRQPSTSGTDNTDTQSVTAAAIPTSSTSVRSSSVHSSPATAAHDTEFAKSKWAQMLASAWVLVSGLLLLFAIRSAVRAVRIRRLANIARNDQVTAIARRAAAYVGLENCPPVLLSERVHTPVAIGTVSPAVVLPLHLSDKLADDELNDILIHEFAHLKRRDSWIVILQAMAKCLFWPLPVVHILNRQLARTREEVCDMFVLEQRDGIRYGEILLRLAEFADGRSPLAGALGMLHWQGALEVRVRQMLDEHRSQRKRAPLRFSLGSLLVFASATIAVCGIRFVEAVETTIQPPPAKEDATPDGAATSNGPTKKRIDVLGIVRNEAGKPIPDAKVTLLAVNDQDKVLATTVTRQDGTYRFNNIDPPGYTISVFATADDHALSWHGMRFLRPNELRPDSTKKGSPEDDSFYKDEQLEMDIVLLKQGRLFGRVRGEDGVSIANANVEILSIDYLKTDGRTRHQNFREFRGFQFVPKSIAKSLTDKDGRFEFTHLPAGTRVWVRTTHKNFADQYFYAAVTDSKITLEERDFIASLSDPLVRISPVGVFAYPTRPVTIRVVDAAKKPVAGIPVFATSGGRATGNNAYGTTGKTGTATLKLPAGDYRLMARGPRGSIYVSTPGHIKFTADDDSPESEIQIKAGCKLVFKVVDAVTGQPVKDVKFFYSKRSGSYNELQPHPSYISNDLRTDENGEAVAIVPPGKREYGVGFRPLPKDYKGPGSYEGGGVLECEEGKTIRTEFKLQVKKP